MTKATNNVARVAAAVAGFSLVAMSVLPAFAGAQTTTTTTTTTSSATFTRDLTIGSTGADVTALQAWLIAKGFSIPAGATGYFGAQTKAALAAYQAANMITPAVGYFGPITRAKVAAAGGSTTTTGLPAGCTSTAGFSPTTGVSCSSGSTTTTSTGGLSGGEADLRSFDLLSGDVVSEGDTSKEIAVAQFDVRNGDARIQRVTVELTSLANPTGASKLPWKFFDTLSVYNGSKKIGDTSAGSKSDWSKDGNTYSLDIPVDSIVKEGDNVELSIRADAQTTIDTSDAAQTFKLVVPTNGIRAVDSQGIQQYAGSDSTNVTVDFDTADSGSLVVTASSDNPNAGVIVADDKNTSDDFDVLKFSIRNKDNTDVDFNTLTFAVATTSASGSAAADITDIVRRATLDLDGDTYTGTVNTDTITFDNLSTSIGAKSTIDGTLTVSLYGQTGHFAASGEALTFSLVGNTTNVDAESADNGDSSSVSGTASGKKQSIGVNTGIMVAGNSNTTSESYNSTTPASSTGTFNLKFDVTANGNDVYVPKYVATTTAASTTAGVVLDANLGASTVGASVPASISSTADVDSNNSSFYIVHDGDTETFTAQVTFDPSASGYYQIGLDKVRFSETDDWSGLQTLDVDQTDSEFQTQQLYIH